MNKVGMATWKLLAAILAIICLLVLLAFSKEIYDVIVDLLAKIGDWFW